MKAAKQTPWPQCAEERDHMGEQTKQTNMTLSLRSKARCISNLVPHSKDARWIMTKVANTMLGYGVPSST